MPNLTEQLKRDGNLLTRSQPTPKKRKRIPAMSAKRKKEAAIYSKKRKAFLEARPYCMAFWLIVRHTKLMPMMGFYGTAPASEEIHHVAKRGKNYLDESTWLAVCRWSHNWIEANKSTARKLGLLCH